VTKNLGYTAFVVAVAVTLFLLCGNPFSNPSMELRVEVGLREGRRAVTDFDVVIDGVRVESTREEGSDFRVVRMDGLAADQVVEVSVRRGDMASDPRQMFADPRVLRREGSVYVWRHMFTLTMGLARVTVLDGDGQPLPGVLVATAADTMGTTGPDGTLRFSASGSIAVYPFLGDGVRFDPPEASISSGASSTMFRVRQVETLLEVPMAGRLEVDGASLGSIGVGGVSMRLPAGPALAVFTPSNPACRADSQMVNVTARDRAAIIFAPRCGELAAVVSSPPETGIATPRETVRSDPPRETTTRTETSTPVTPPPREVVRDPVTPPPSRDEPAITSPEVTRPPSEAYRPEATDESREEAILQPPVRLFFFAERSGSLLVDEETVAKLVPGTPFAKSFPLDSEFTAKLLDIDGAFGADYVAALAFAQDHPECSHNAIVEPPRSAYGQEEYRELLAIQGRSFAALGRWEQAVDAFRESLDFGTDAQVGADLAICETNLKKYGAANEALEVAERSAQLNGAPTEVWEVIRAYRVFVLHGQYKSAPPPTQEGRESYRNQICRAISTYEDRHPGGVNEALVQNVRALVCG
jgi:hypothetical protein